MEEITLTKENVLQVIQEARKALAKVPDYPPYIDATHYEKEYREALWDSFDKICFISKPL